MTVPLFDAVLAWLTAARGFFFFVPPADPFWETEVIPVETFFVWRCFFRLAFTFANVSLLANNVLAEVQRLPGAPRAMRGQGQGPRDW